MPSASRDTLVVARALGAAAVALSVAGAALGQETPQSSPQATDGNPPQPTTPPAVDAASAAKAAAEAGQVHYQLRVRGELGFSAELVDAPGDVTVNRAGASFGAFIPIGQRALLSVSAEYEHDSYDFNNATGFAPGTDSPFGEVNREWLGARYSQQLSERWGGLVGGSIGLSGEEGAKVGDSLFGVAFVGARYAFSKNFQLGGGVVLASQLERSVLVLPLVLMDWQITKEWTLSNEGRLGLTLTYQPSDHWAFGLGANYELREFRLDRDGPVPGGVGRETRVPLQLTVSYTPTRQLTIDGGVGVSLGQSFRVEDNNGNELNSISAQAQPYINLQLTYRF